MSEFCSNREANRLFRAWRQTREIRRIVRRTRALRFASSAQAPRYAGIFRSLRVVGKHYRLCGGEGWIRTPGTLLRSVTDQRSPSLDHSAPRRVSGLFPALSGHSERGWRKHLGPGDHFCGGIQPASRRPIWRSHEESSKPALLAAETRASFWSKDTRIWIVPSFRFRFGFLRFTFVM
jgi:hypothetical protein